MPKYNYGQLITCEKTIAIFLINSERTKGSIIKVLDDNHLLVKDNDVEIIKEEIYKMQDTLTEVPIDKLINK